MTELKRVKWNHHREATKELHRKIEEFVAKYHPQVIEEYEENGIVIKRYEAR